MGFGLFKKTPILLSCPTWPKCHFGQVDLNLFIFHERIDNKSMSVMGWFFGVFSSFWEPWLHIRTGALIVLEQWVWTLRTVLITIRGLFQCWVGIWFVEYLLVLSIWTFRIEEPPVAVISNNPLTENHQISWTVFSGRLFDSFPPKFENHGYVRTWYLIIW